MINSTYKLYLIFNLIVWIINLSGHNLSAQDQQQQKVKVRVHSMKCVYTDYYGKNDELYGRVWVLNLRIYKNVKNALDFFHRKEIMKLGDGSGPVLEISRDAYVQLKKDQSHLWNNVSKEISVLPSDEIIIIGEFADRDWGNADDKLMAPESVYYKVIKVNTIQDATYQVDLSFKNSQSKVNMLIYSGQYN
jgi:hypothetical protein